jgi:hypothetical protein
MRLAMVALVLTSSTVATAHPNHCCCDQVVGRSTCHRLGDHWASWMPPIIVEMGFAMRRTTFPESPLDGDVIARAIDDSGDRRLDTFGTEMRLGVDLRSGVSILGHVDVGFASADGLISTGIALGWRTTRGRVVFGAELLGGARWFMLGGTYDEASETTTYAEVDAALLLDARVRADVWLLPWLSANVWLGRGVLEHDDLSGGVTFSVATRPFRGR